MRPKKVLSVIYTPLELRCGKSFNQHLTLADTQLTFDVCE